MKRLLIVAMVLTVPAVSGAVEESAPVTPAASAAPAEPTAPATSSGKTLTLEHAYRLANQNNPTLDVMQARVADAEAEKQRAWASIHPIASLNGNYTINEFEIALDPSRFAPPGTPAGPDVVIQKREQFGFKASAGVPIFRGPSYFQISSAKESVKSAEFRYIRSRQDFMLRVATAYYLALGLREVVSALEDKVGVDQNNLKSVKARYDVGQSLRSDVMRAELILTQDQQELLQRRNEFIAGLARVSILIGLPDRQPELVRPPEPVSPSIDDAVAVDQAIQKRPDIRALEFDVSAAQKSKTAAWWAFLPTLDFNFAYQWQEAAGFAPSRGYYTMLLNLGLPIYEATRYAQLNSARARVSESKATKEEFLRDIADTLARLKSELLSAEAGLVSAEHATTLADITASEMAVRYQAGTATQLDVLDASQRRLEAQIDLTRSRYTRDLARISLAHALGGFDPH